MTEKPLSQMRAGECGVVTAVAESEMARRLMDIGCLVGARIDFLGRGPFGDPAAYRICGAVIAVRDRDAAAVRVALTESKGPL